MNRVLFAAIVLAGILALYSALSGPDEIPVRVKPSEVVGATPTPALR